VTEPSVIVPVGYSLQEFGSKRRWLVRESCLICAAAVLAMGTALAKAQTESPSKPASIGAQAASVVLKHYAMNPTVDHPTTGLPLPADGSWSLSKTRPAACPQTDEKCVEVFYDVPAASVRCSWAVQLNADSTDGQFLDENDNAATYMVRILPKGEASALVSSRKKPAYPPIALAAQVQGEVFLNVIVDKRGDAQTFRILSGNPMLQWTSIEAAKKWKFRPLMVGSRAVPYQVKLVFNFQPNPQIITGDLAP
jgi:TonB family protein